MSTVYICHYVHPKDDERYVEESECGIDYFAEGFWVDEWWIPPSAIRGIVINKRK